MSKITFIFITIKFIFRNKQKKDNYHDILAIYIYNAFV